MIKFEYNLLIIVDSNGYLFYLPNVGSFFSLYDDLIDSYTYLRFMIMLHSYTNNPIP